MGTVNSRAAAIGVALILAATTTACGHDPASDHAPARTTASVAVASSSPPRGGEHTVVTAAERIFTTWAQRSLTYKQWWAQLKPLLSPAARLAYANTDPANIPHLRLTGNAHRTAITNQNCTECDPDNITVVALPTNRGRFEMALEHGQPGVHGWVMFNLAFPKGIH